MSVPTTSDLERPAVASADFLVRVAREYGDADADLVRRAYAVAARAHGPQVRRSGLPYLSHPLAVAEILADLHLDAVSLAVALLHDVVEDTGVTEAELADEFGLEIAKLVLGVTKIGRMEFNSEVEQQAGNFRKLLLAMVEDPRVLLVKLADRVHNMRTLGWLKPDKQRRIAAETLEIYAPLAHRLGIGRVQSELEDMSFRYMDPEASARLEAALAHRLETGQDLICEIKDQIESALLEHEIPCRVTHRVKGLYSLQRKMVARDLEIDQVYDLVAYRIITDTVRNCYGSLGIMHNRWSPVPGRFKDFIAMPKRNMYQSLHTTLMERGQPFEVQIRTEEMHRVAEEGIAAHWLYKEGGDDDAQPLSWLRQLVEWQREVSDPSEFLSSLKLNLYPDEVYVFTPKGQVRSLPRGATPIDFAYMIHTEIGERCSGAKVNGKLVPLRQELRNGDRVEILTQPEAKPSRDWLQVVKTSRARNRIRNWINKQERARSQELGRKLLDKELRKYGLRFRKLQNDGSLDRVAAQVGVGAAEDLMVALSFGKVMPRAVVERLLPSDELEKRAEKRQSRVRRLVDKALGWRADDTIQVRGMDGILVYRARCCGPVPGEPIVGYVTRGKGVSVHSTSCGNIARLLQTEDRRVEVVWSGTEGSVQPIRLRVEVDNRPGVLAALTSRIAEAGSNIRHIESKIEGYRGRIELVIEVEDSAHLSRLTSAMDAIDGVRAVVRGRAPGDNI